MRLQTALKLIFVANVGFICYIRPCLNDSDDICDQKWCLQCPRNFQQSPSILPSGYFFFLSFFCVSIRAIKKHKMWWNKVEHFCKYFGWKYFFNFKQMKGCTLKCLNPNSPFSHIPWYTRYGLWWCTIKISLVAEGSTVL